MSDGVATRSDAEVIEASLADGTEFTEIYERYWETIYRYVARRIGSSSAGDLASDVFVKAFEARTRYDLDRPLCRPWLYGIASNLIRDYLRRLKRKERAYLHAQTVEDTATQSIELEHERIEAVLAIPEINKALSKLNKGDREVLLLFAIAELSYEETATALEIPIGTVRSRLARARKRMQELLPGFGQTTRRNSTDEDRGDSA